MATLEERTGQRRLVRLTDEQKALRDLAHDFAEREIRPTARRVRRGHRSHPADVIAKAHELGLMNLHIPEELGGPSLGASRACSIGEELCWGCSGIGTSIVANGLGAAPVLHRGHRGAEARVAAAARRGADPLLVRADRAERRLRRLGHPDDGRARRRRVRPQRLEDVHHQRRPRGLDRSSSPRPTRTQGHRGLTAFVVPTDADGVVGREASRQDGAARDRHLGARRSRTSWCRRRTGSARRARASRSRCRRSTSRAPGTAIGAVGVARAAFEYAGRVLEASASSSGMPIAMNQGVNFLIADMATEIEAARLLTLAGGVDARPADARDAAVRRTRSASPPTLRWRSRPTPCRSSAATGT